MIAQLNDTLVFQAFYVDTLVGATGLTVTVDVYRDGSSVATAQAATEVGGGLYQFSYAATSVAGRYTAIFKTVTITVDQRHIADTILVGKTWTQNINATVSSRLADADASTRVQTGLTAQGLTTTRAAYLDNISILSFDEYVTLSHNLILTSGVNYDHDTLSGLFESFTFSNIDLTNATIALRVKRPKALTSYVGVVASSSQLYVDFSAANYVDQFYEYDLIATYTGNVVIVLAEGQLRTI